MRWIASRAGVAYMAPGALNTAGSALCAFLSTVVAKSRGVGHPLLGEAAESDLRVERLVALVHTSCAAPLSSDDESAYDCDEAEREANSDRTDIHYVWEHTLRTRWAEAPGYELTEHDILSALEALNYKVYGGIPTLSEMARTYHERFGRDVLGLLRDGILNVERFLSELDDEKRDVVDDRYFGLRLTKSPDRRQHPAVEPPWCGAVGCPCPCCGRECLLWLVTYAGRAEVISVKPVVDMDAVRVAQTRAGERWTGCVFFDRDPPVAPPKLWTVLPTRRRPLRQGMGGADLAVRAHRMLTETAARRAGFTHWAPEVEGLVGGLVQKWGKEIAVLARVYHQHDTSVLALSSPLTFSSVARAVVTLLERTKQRFPVLYVRPFDATLGVAAALHTAFPYAEPLLGPNEMSSIFLDDESGPSSIPVTFDAGANELMSRVFAHRLAWLFHRARPVSPVFDLPGGGRGPVLVPHVLSFIDSSGDNLAGFGPRGPRTGYH